jgi:hypothetical protein
MLTVVQHQKRASPAEKVDDTGQVDLRVDADREAQRRRDSRDDSVGIRDIGQFDQPHVRRRRRGHLSCRLDREPRLADTTGTDKCDEPSRAQ